MTEKKLFYGRHNIEQEDLHAISLALESGWLTNGPKVKELEEDFCNFTGAQFSIAVSSGTAALHLCALTLAQLNKDTSKVVITTPLTFVATASAFIHANYKVDFVDIDPNTNNLDLDKLRDKVAQDPDRYVGVVPVHFAGLSVDMEAVKKIADEYNLWIVEDAAHAIGASFKDSQGRKNYVGSSTFAEATIFSMHPVKHITSGEGGLITTNSKNFADTLKLLRNHSMDRNNVGKPWEYDIKFLGFNYRLTEMQSSMASSQLKRVDKFIKRRQEIAKIYNEAFRHLPLKSIKPSKKFKHSYHLYVIETEKRDELFAYLNLNNIIGQVHYVPVHRFSYFQENGFKGASYPHVEKYYGDCLSLPIYPDLSPSEQQKVIKTVYSFFQNE